MPRNSINLRSRASAASALIGDDLVLYTVSMDTGTVGTCTYGGGELIDTSPSSDRGGLLLSMFILVMKARNLAEGDMDMVVCQEW